VADGRTLGVACDGNLGVRAVLQSLLGKFRKLWTAICTLGDIGLDSRAVVDTLDCDSVGAEGRNQRLCQSRANGRAHIAGLSRPTGEDQGDGSTDWTSSSAVVSEMCLSRQRTSILNIVGRGTSTVARLTLGCRGGEGNGSTVKNVGEGRCRELHVERFPVTSDGLMLVKMKTQTPGLNERTSDSLEPMYRDLWTC